MHRFDTITERVLNPDCFHLYFDLDIKCKKEHNDNELLQALNHFLKLCFKKLREMYSDFKDETCHFVVFRSRKPLVDKGTNEEVEGKWKIGFHIIFDSILVSKWEALALRRTILEDLDGKPIFPQLETDEDNESIYDSSVYNAGLRLPAMAKPSRLEEEQHRDNYSERYRRNYRHLRKWRPLYRFEENSYQLFCHSGKSGEIVEMERCSINPVYRKSSDQEFNAMKLKLTDEGKMMVVVEEEMVNKSQKRVLFEKEQEWEDKHDIVEKVAEMFYDHFPYEIEENVENYIREITTNWGRFSSRVWILKGRPNEDKCPECEIVHQTPDFMIKIGRGETVEAKCLTRRVKGKFKDIGKLETPLYEELGGLSFHEFGERRTEKYLLKLFKGHKVEIKISNESILPLYKPYNPSDQVQQIHGEYAPKGRGKTERTKAFLEQAKVSVSHYMILQSKEAKSKS
jgi:hypothetical protein